MNLLTLYVNSFSFSRSHALRGNAAIDALRRIQKLRRVRFFAPVQDAERPGNGFHVERGTRKPGDGM